MKQIEVNIWDVQEKRERPVKVRTEKVYGTLYRYIVDGVDQAVECFKEKRHWKVRIVDRYASGLKVRYAGHVTAWSSIEDTLKMAREYGVSAVVAHIGAPYDLIDAQTGKVVESH